MLEEIIQNIYAQIGIIVSGILAIIKILKTLWAKITSAKAKTDRRDIENTKKAIQELKEEIIKNDTKI